MPIYPTHLVVTGALSNILCPSGDRNQWKQTYGLFLAAGTQCGLKTLPFVALSPYQWLVFLNIGPESAVVAGIVDCIQASEMANCNPRHEYNFLLGCWNERVLKQCSTTATSVETVLASWLLEAHQVEMWCLSILGYAPKRTRHPSVCCSPLHQMLREKKMKLEKKKQKSRGWGRLTTASTRSECCRSWVTAGAHSDHGVGRESGRGPHACWGPTTKLSSHSTPWCSPASSFTREGFFFLGFLKRRSAYDPVPRVRASA